MGKFQNIILKVEKISNKNWFSRFTHDLATKIETPKDSGNMWNILASRNHKQILRLNKPKRIYSSRSKFFIATKIKLDRIAVQNVVFRLTKILVQHNDILSLSIDYNQNNLFLWIETNDNEQGEKEISLILEQLKPYHQALGLLIRPIIISQSIGLEVPPDYETLFKKN